MSINSTEKSGERDKIKKQLNDDFQMLLFLYKDLLNSFNENDQRYTSSEEPKSLPTHLQDYVRKNQAKDCIPIYREIDKVLFGIVEYGQLLHLVTEADRNLRAFQQLIADTANLIHKIVTSSWYHPNTGTKAAAAWAQRHVTPEAKPSQGVSKEVSKSQKSPINTMIITKPIKEIKNVTPPNLLKENLTALSFHNYRLNAIISIINKHFSSKEFIEASNEPSPLGSILRELQRF